MGCMLRAWRQTYMSLWITCSSPASRYLALPWYVVLTALLHVSSIRVSVFFYTVHVIVCLLHAMSVTLHTPSARSALRHGSPSAMCAALSALH